MDKIGIARGSGIEYFLSNYYTENPYLSIQKLRTNLISDD